MCRPTLFDLGGRIGAVPVRHRHVHDNEIDATVVFEFLYALERDSARLGFPNNFHVGLRANSYFQAIANNRVIVNDKDAEDVFLERSHTKVGRGRSTGVDNVAHSSHIYCFPMLRLVQRCTYK